MHGQIVDLKVVLLGKEYGGKTSLVERFLYQRFSGNFAYQNTIGAAYGAKKVDALGRQVVLGIWDTAGSERYQAMSRIYYRGAWAAILCYDLTDDESFDRARSWVIEMEHYEPDARVYFVGTKKDLLNIDCRARKVACSSVVEFAQKNGHSRPIFETSALSGENVDQVFMTIAHDFVKEEAAKSGRTKQRDGAVLSSCDPVKTWCNC